MARYPTYDEYKDKPDKGIRRCDELLKKNPNDAQILITKLQLLAAVSDSAAATQIVSQLMAVQPSIQDLSEISSIEEAIIELRSSEYPPTLTAGPDVAKLWDSAFKASQDTNHKLDLQSLRFSRAMVDSRLIDAQQSLIQLKVLLPKNRVFYMAHAAVTQMLSTSEQDLQSRLALSLARKAVSEKFDDDTSLDCRVPGQIFAQQASLKDIETVAGRALENSRQVFEATRPRAGSGQDRGVSPIPSLDEETVPPKEWLRAETASLKSQFSKLAGSDSRLEALERFAANAVQLYVTSTKSLSLRTYRPSADAIFLAVSALVQSWQLTRSSASLLQAAFLAQGLLKDNSQVHEAKVVLVYLYMRLGLPSLAVKHWDSLSIKEVQYDTIGHAFLTRLSITHPHSFAGGKLREAEPIRLATLGIGVYRRCEERLAESHASVLSHGQTGMMFDLHELRESLRLSLTRRIISIEQRRLARLLNRVMDVKIVHLYPRLTAAWLDTRDTRDFSATFDYGFNVERTLHELEQPKSWILFNLAADSLWCLVHDYSPAIKDTAELLVQLDQISTQDSTTDQEFLVGNLTHQLLRLAFIASEANGGSSQDLKAVEAAIKKLNIESLVAVSELFPPRVHNVYLNVDALRLVSAFCRYMEQKKASSKAEVKDLRRLAEDEFRRLQKYAKEQAAGIEKSHVEEVVTGGEERSVPDCLKQFGEDAIGLFSASLAESAKDVWSGVAQLKLT